MRMPLLIGLVAMTACHDHPGYPDQGVAFRDTEDDGATSGERGQVIVNEILWSGSVTDDGVRDQSDVFIELRNQGHRPLNLSGWHIEIHGAIQRTIRIPDSDRVVQVGEEVFVAAKDTRCFPDPDYVAPDLVLPDGDPILVVLRDHDKRLLEPAGSEDMPPFAGGWDLVTSRSMERINLMFGPRGTAPHIWTFYTDAPTQKPNDDRIAPECRRYTRASPGRPNSPDYSGAYASGTFE